MDFSDIVGFLITLAAIFYMFIKRAQDARKRANEHENEEGEPHQADKLKDFLRSLEIDMEESEDFRPPPQPKITKSESKPPLVNPRPPILPRQAPKRSNLESEFSFRSDLDDFKMKTNIEERKLKIDVKNKFEGDYGDHLLRPEFRGEKLPRLVGFKKPSRIRLLLSSLPSKKDIVIINEILNTPKGFK